MSLLSRLFTTLTESSSLASSSLIAATQKTHARILKSGAPIERQQLVQRYCDADAFRYACQLFDEVPNWDLFSSTAIISSFSRRNRHRDAIFLFSLTLRRNLRPNQFTFGAVLPSVTALHDLAAGKQLHSSLLKMGLQSDVFAGSSLLDHYAKLGNLEETRRAFDEICEPNVVSYTALLFGYLKNSLSGEALRIFCRMPEKTVVSWNAMISGFNQMGLIEECIKLFVEMNREGIFPNIFTFPSVLSAAADIPAIAIGRSFHAFIIKVLPKLNVYVGNSLIIFYSKCGCLQDGLLVFENLDEKNIVSWNAVIYGYAQNGNGEAAIKFFKRMKSNGLKPNGFSILGLLFGCSHSGLVDEGLEYFKRFVEEEPGLVMPEHCASVVDLLSRSGRIAEAEKFLNELPFDPGIGFWKSALGGCQIHSKRDFAVVFARRILELDPEEASSFVLLSNVQSSAGNWQDVARVRTKMEDKSMKRVPGSSWIEVQGKIHDFFNGDRRHSQADEIYFVLGVLHHS
ncbi:Pentatricopeptide repeat-containing protein [Apostasia shenzhenica]|uniref:Pentatricopeptide repeat-containing protein n=1 Tax=Apostasia shenzhenica TaxID=1088818 RepID=A0A2H9ZZ35_9ASPA|nr:Pentatricopeptide repeat-containing protein [Apostasia shenzhenica]